MRRRIVDTNVAVVANGRGDGKKPISKACRTASIAFLLEVVTRDRILVDAAGEVAKEYRRHLSPKGQPGVGDRFCQLVMTQGPEKVEHIELARAPDGSYADLPAPVAASTLDQSDRKFAALAARTGAAVSTSTDRGWTRHATLLSANGLSVQFLCGCNPAGWFSDTEPV